jgi:cell fate regulator YaaT (PSP1 superfamily)
MNENPQDIDFSRGCCFLRNDQDEASALSLDGGQKLCTYDWLSDLPQTAIEYDVFEVRFKNTRKGYYRNTNKLPLKKGDIVAVEASPGHDIGIISLTGILVARQMKKTGVHPNNLDFKKIYRKAKPTDIEKWQESIAREQATMIRSRQIANQLRLNMKVGDVEFQGDNTKAIFYYIADERVDFRQLIKDLAEAFKIRVEMRQIGARQEAGRIGGIGSCGRELCCSTWITNFSSVTTTSARHQEISLNPQKLAGQCSKLKCCLNYELDTYLDAQKDFPRVSEPLQLFDGLAFLHKTDILKKIMWFSSAPDSTLNLTAVSVDRVKEIIDLNRRGQKADKLLGEIGEEMLAKAKLMQEPDFKNVVGEDSITRFDRSGKRSSRGGRNRNRGGNPPQNNGRQSQSQPQQQDRPSRGPQDRPERRPNPNRSENRPARNDNPTNAAGNTEGKRPDQAPRSERNPRNEQRQRPSNGGNREGGRSGDRRPNRNRPSRPSEGPSDGGKE